MHSSVVQKYPYVLVDTMVLMTLIKLFVSHADIMKTCRLKIILLSSANIVRFKKFLSFP
jgi:hypothetical protein